jgi:hypothetical protein
MDTTTTRNGCGISANLLVRKDLFDIANGSEERPMDKDVLKA